MKKTAILVDGGFYKKRAARLCGNKAPEDRASELFSYCMKHIHDNRPRHREDRELYRIFFYDCPPLSKCVFNPLTKSNVDFGKSDTYTWTIEFFNALKKRRKVALRMGKLLDKNASYTIGADKFKALCLKKITMDDLTESDLEISFRQKGVDMRIGLDIASLAFKQQVDQIILIAGDSDFVPAAKLARREGIDFILDPMEANISDDLFEHIDGLQTYARWLAGTQQHKKPAELL